MDPDSSSQLGSVLTVLVIALFFSGLISAYESALSSLSSIRLQKRAEEGDKKSKYLAQILHEPHQTLLTLMICDWLADVTVIVLTSWCLFHGLVWNG